MKRLLAAGTFTLAAGAIALLLAASIFYSCRSGGDPHHEQSDATLDAPPVEHARATPNVHRASASWDHGGMTVSVHRR
jgi:ABC-type transport system involved in cytochrome bd biosynthesis fused ATPase/permease subunit